MSGFRVLWFRVLGVAGLRVLWFYGSTDTYKKAKLCWGLLGCC